MLNHSPTGGHLGCSHFLPTGCQLGGQWQLSSEHVRPGKQGSQEEDGLIRVSAKDGKDDDNLGHTQNK